MQTRSASAVSLLLATMLASPTLAREPKLPEASNPLC